MLQITAKKKKARQNTRFTNNRTRGTMTEKTTIGPCLTRTPTEETEQTGEKETRENADK